MSDLLSVTIVSPDGSLGDGLATAFMIAGLDKSINMIMKMNLDFGVIFIREGNNGNNEVIASKNLEGLIVGAKHNVKFFAVK